MENITCIDKACSTVVINTEFIIMKPESIWEYWQAFCFLFWGFFCIFLYYSGQ